VVTIQINGPERRSYLMSTEATLLDALLRRTNGPSIYDHGESELSIANINPAGLGSRVIRILHLLPEISTDAIRRTMGPTQNCTGK
jgi:hypothetical protein